MNLKTCLVASNCLEVSPYVQRYMKMLNHNNIKYDIIEKRYIGNKRLDSAENIETFYYKDVKTPLGKMMRFVKYALFIRRKIQSENYDRIVLFSALNSAICYFWTRRYIQGKYIVDIRDYDKSAEIPFIKHWYHKVIKEAEMVIISSEKFKTWLPGNRNTFVMHNLPGVDMINQDTHVFDNETITIAYLGSIGYYEQNVNLVNSLSVFPNIKIKYHGRYPHTDNIKEYCQKMGYKNVYFGGAFKNDEKQELYENVDFINAIYGNDSLVVTTALPNKLYDCLYYKIPIIVNEGTYLAELVEQYGLGIAVDTQKDDLYKKIRAYIETFDKKRFLNNCMQLLDQVSREQLQTESAVLNFTRGNIDEN